MIEGKIHAQEPKHKFFCQGNKGVSIKKKYLNIFKVKSLFRVNSKRLWLKRSSKFTKTYSQRVLDLLCFVYEREKKETMEIQTLTRQMEYW